MTYPINVHQEIIEQRFKIKEIEHKIQEGKVWKESTNQNIKAIQSYIDYLVTRFFEVGKQEN